MGLAHSLFCGTTFPKYEVRASIVTTLPFAVKDLQTCPILMSFKFHIHWRAPSPWTKKEKPKERGKEMAAYPHAQKNKKMRFIFWVKFSVSPREIIKLVPSSSSGQYPEREHAILVPRVGTRFPILIHHEVNRASHESSQMFDSHALWFGLGVLDMG